ncbi:hypothetical protein AO367_0746 [Moraxella catarrhalis]|nr:hypothetical protein AO367_0746 [Moraxella catarrhalis]
MGIFSLMANICRYGQHTQYYRQQAKFRCLIKAVVLNYDDFTSYFNSPVSFEPNNYVKPNHISSKNSSPKN